MTDDGTLEIQRVEEANGVVLRASGDIDLTTAPRVQDALAATAQARVILDLTGVTFLDSAGIRAIDLGARAFREERRLLLVVAPPDSRAGWTLKVAGFSDGVVVGSMESASKREIETTS